MEKKRSLSLFIIKIIKIQFIVKKTGKKTLNKNIKSNIDKFSTVMRGCAFINEFFPQKKNGEKPSQSLEWNTGKNGAAIPVYSVVHGTEQ